VVMVGVTPPPLKKSCARHWLQDICPELDFRIWNTAWNAWCCWCSSWPAPGGAWWSHP